MRPSKEEFEVELLLEAREEDKVSLFILKKVNRNYCKNKKE